MKIGILTYHRSHNYGAMLQAYALQTCLRGLGHDAEIIDYWPQYHSDLYTLFPRLPKTMTWKGKLKKVILFGIGFSKIMKRHRGYERFAEERFGVSRYPQFKSAEDLNSTTYDTVIYGSDQIWRKQKFFRFTGFNEVYFGVYPNTVRKKITYAASMGVIDLNHEDETFLRRVIKNFDAVSVRETELQKIVKEVAGRKATQVVDPVCLLAKTDWQSLLKQCSIQSRYILLYQLLSCPASLTLASRLQEYYKCKVIEVRGRVYPLLFGSRYKQTATPLEFLSLIQGADFVVSTSFHGAAFSVIFEKQFYAMGMGQNARRVQTFLSSLGIEQRYLQNLNDADFREVIDYTKVSALLEVMKENSIAFLRRTIDGNEIE